MVNIFIFYIHIFPKVAFWGGGPWVERWKKILRSATTPPIADSILDLYLQNSSKKQQQQRCVLE